MRRDTSVVFIALADLLLCVLAVVIVAVNPHAQAAGVPPKAEYLITADWTIDQVDADVDLWLIPPGDKPQPVYFRNRRSGLAVLDQDCLGKDNSTAVTDGGQTITSRTCRETTTLRGVVPGHYDVALNLYRVHDDAGERDLKPTEATGVKVRVEVIQINPVIRTLYASDIVLDHVTDTRNVVSFDLSAANVATLVPPPATPVTTQFVLRAP